VTSACSILVRGVVQGVGFRPFVYRLAQRKMLAGWVLNGEQGVEIHLEGAESDLQAFVREMYAQPPAAASIAAVEVESVPVEGLRGFTIRESQRAGRPTVRVSPDLPVCQDCLNELFDSSDRRYRYPYVNCTNCGPRYSVVLALPYDRPNTSMKDWPMDAYCDSEYHDPMNRRFHAQPVACPACGPGFTLHQAGANVAHDWKAIEKAAELLREGKIVAIKGRCRESCIERRAAAEKVPQRKTIRHYVQEHRGGEPVGCAHF
jgi:hydrogenase maturation protein HypF